MLSNQPLSSQEERGKVECGSATPASPHTITLSALITIFLGINGQLSTSPFRSRPRVLQIFVEGEGISASQLSKRGLPISRPSRR